MFRTTQARVADLPFITVTLVGTLVVSIDGLRVGSAAVVPYGKKLSSSLGNDRGIKFWCPRTFSSTGSTAEIKEENI